MKIFNKDFAYTVAFGLDCEKNYVQIIWNWFLPLQTDFIGPCLAAYGELGSFTSHTLM